MMKNVMSIIFILILFSINGSALIEPVTSVNIGSLITVSETIGDYLYIGSDITNMRIYDLSTPSTPVLIDTIGISPYSLYLNGSYLYAASTSGVTIYDVTDPINPIELDTDTTCLATWCEQIITIDDYLYVTDAGTKIYILDISNKSNITSVGSFSSAFSSTRLLIDGDTLFLDDANAIRSYDITNRSAPIFKDSISSNEIFGWQIKNNYIFTTTVVPPADTIYVYDISNTSNIVQVESLDLGGWGRGLEIIDNKLITLSESNNNLNIVDISNPLDISIMETYTLTAFPRVLSIIDNTIVVFDHDPVAYMNILYYPFVAEPTAEVDISSNNSRYFDTILSNSSEIGLFITPIKMITVFTDKLGSYLFWVMMIGLFFMMYWIRQENVLIPSLLGLIGAVLISPLLPPEAEMIFKPLLSISIVGLIYQVIKAR